MIKKTLHRFMNGFFYSIGITMIVHTLILYITGVVPILPDFVARFDSELKAYMTELFLIGIMSGITSSSTLVLEARKIGMILQDILFIIIMLAAWIPIACFVWGFHRYRGSMISTVFSIVVTYAICRWLTYRNCKKDIDEINAKLRRRKE